MGRLEGKTAIVTGAASGLGEATARRFAQEGAKVILTDISDEGAAVARDIGGDAQFLLQDVANEARWAEVVGHAEESWGRLDILINNAGISMFGLVTDLTYAQWRRCIEVDLDSVFLGTRAAIPLMRRSGGGAIVNISSMAGITGQRALSAYCAAKGGVRFFSKAVALECASARDNIRVNSVHPGIIDTPIFHATEADERRAPVGPQAMDVGPMAAFAVPMGVPGKAEDIAAACLYLASDDGRYVTGTEVIVDGGFCAA
ncbi:3-oxoacyl-(acyl-carrier-protein) reductase [Sphingobium chlorophenolicum L-1]|uniref:3-oxoacyl-(Acyl-carrier-protein) reductase n=2 Tax=Sphingobium chlorophenolicum TaxID=46429 RepID=F6F1L9_SPHCR|nr:glucose 1-dehydrogenase [Sphingobium chlorophenolicum]AEG51435.1 3-oxoacyl-(acyl-carrier-protein) reductase [Sphingobium chlorophenolicum L-1]KEQ53536.1 3-oxoacyl-(Acyl-carrier-protein) reductase [Sphingobium chlorophenolicum]